MKVVVVGAGYAGAFAANRVARRIGSARVTVVNPRSQFVERVRLHQRVAGTAPAAVPLASMLRAGIAVRVGTAAEVGDGAVVLADGGRIAFDHAFLAVGSTVRPLPGTIPIGTWEGAERARAALAALPAGGTVAVVGGGPTGVETAAEVADARPDLRVRLVGSAVGGSFSGGARLRVRTGLERLGVGIVDDDVTRVGGGAVHLRAGAGFAADLVLWAVVSGVPDLAARSGLAVDPGGRALVDGALRSVTDDRISAVGDCAAVPGARMACQSAGPQAAHAVDALLAAVEGREPATYRVRYVGLGVRLGRRDAVGQLTHPDDTLRPTHLAGRPAALAKEAASRAAKLAARTGRNRVRSRR